jgi:hypothetical protein
LHFDFLVRPSNRHPYINRNAAANLKNNIGSGVMLEALGHDIQRVGTDSQIGKAVEAVSLCDRNLFYLSRNVGNGDGSALNDRASGVSDGALDTPGSRDLAVSLCGKGKDRNTEDNRYPTMDPTATRST